MQPESSPEAESHGLRTSEGSADGEKKERSVAPPLVVVINERAFRCECLVRILRDVMPGYNVATADCPRNTTPWAPGDGQEINVIILDIGWTRLPDERVDADVRFLKERFGGVPIVLLSDREDSAHVASALDYGVRGLIPTTQAAAVVAEAVRLVGAGGTFAPANALIHALNTHQNGTVRGWRSRGRAVGLTPRELQVLNLLREGKPNKIIAVMLDLKETTVKIHVRHIMKKMKATNRTEAAIMAERVL
jgi:DNA-binding NarL/FixJ family response regulator